MALRTHSNSPLVAEASGGGGTRRALPEVMAQVFQFPEIRKINPTAIAMITTGTTNDLSRFDQLWAFALPLGVWDSAIAGALLKNGEAQDRKFVGDLLLPNKTVTTGALPK